MEFWGLFLFLAGFVIGLGAVTVIDVHGFLGRKNQYWTEATIRTHKVTKPLIWAGMILAIAGGLLFYSNKPLTTIPLLHAIAAGVLVLNGCWLSFWLSPRLLEREKKGLARELLPKSWQKAIGASLIVSDIGWWTSLALLAYYLIH